LKDEVAANAEFLVAVPDTVEHLLTKEGIDGRGDSRKRFKSCIHGHPETATAGALDLGTDFGDRDAVIRWPRERRGPSESRHASPAQASAAVT